MRLQLDSTGIYGTSSAYTSEVTPTGGKTADTVGKSSSDSVGLSGTSRLLQTAGTLHGERLARISQAVQAGTYSVSSRTISQAIIGQSGPSGFDPAGSGS